MPETQLRLRWPDEQETAHYSPSSILHDYFKPGESCPVPDFVARSAKAFHAASERVREKYGFSCSRAAASLAAINHKAASFAGQPEARVSILEITP